MTGYRTLIRLCYGVCRNILDRAEATQVDLLMYRKDDPTYRCHVTIDPLYNTLGELTQFLAVEHEYK